MQVDQNTYPLYLAVMAVLGFLLGGVYDFFRLLRVARARKAGGRIWRVVDGAFCFVEDILFALISACTVVLAAYALSRGRPRFFAMLSMLLGFWLWQKTLSLPMRAAVTFLARQIKRALDLTLLRLLRLLRDAVRLAFAKQRTKKELASLTKSIVRGKF